MLKLGVDDYQKGPERASKRPPQTYEVRFFSVQVESNALTWYKNQSHLAFYYVSFYSKSLALSVRSKPASGRI